MGPLGGDTVKHRETQEHVMYILNGRGFSIIDGQKFDWEAAHSLFIPSGAWHRCFDADHERPARCSAVSNKPMVDNLGLAKLEREEPPKGREPR